MSEPTKADRPAPATGERWVPKPDYPGRWYVYVREADGSDTLVGQVGTKADADLLVHGPPVVTALEQLVKVMGAMTAAAATSTATTSPKGMELRAGIEKLVNAGRNALAPFRGTP